MADLYDHLKRMKPAMHRLNRILENADRPRGERDLDKLVKDINAILQDPIFDEADKFKTFCCEIANEIATEEGLIIPFPAGAD